MDILEAVSPTRNAVVSASAGSGKTWLLIARVLRLLLSGAELSSILAITFTEKATAEMRERLQQRLYDWVSADDEALFRQLQEIGIKDPQPYKTSARRLYEDFIRAGDDVHITTFHAFCADLLRQFPFEAQVPIGFQILEDDWELIDQAFDQLFREAVREPATGAALDLLIELCGDSLSNARDALESFLNQRSDWAAFADGRDARTVAEQLRKQMDAEAEAPVLESGFADRLRRHGKLMRVHKERHWTNAAKRLDEVLEHRNEKLDYKVMEDFKAVFYTKQGTVRKVPKSKQLKTQLSQYGISLETYTENFHALVDEFNALASRFHRWRNYRRNKAWYVVGEHLLICYRNLKKTMQVLDFSDLEWYAFQLLHARGAAWVQYRLNQRIRHVLVDEFQDTNPNQWLLLKPLLEEMAAQESGSSAFIVGDPKQSIYGFRRANPELQTDATLWFKDHLSGQEYTMDQSRRSAPQIIEFVNKVFLSDGADSLKDFREHTTAVTSSGKAAALPFFEATTDKPESQWREVLEAPPHSEQNTPAADEATAVARRIQQLIADKTPVRTADQRTRPLSYGDVMILFRNRRNLAYFERALTQCGIPFAGGATEHLLQTQEASDLLALLQLLINPHDDLLLAQTLRSPIFSADDKHLIALARHSKDKNKPWMKCLQEIRDADPLWQRARELLSDWIAVAETLPVHDLLDRIYARGDLIRRYRLNALAENRELSENRLVDFLNYSLDFESGRYPGISGFLNYNKLYLKAHLKHRRRGKTDGDDTAGSGLERVRLLTVHKAKGLEAPVVFFVDCGQEKKPAEAYRSLVTWPTSAPQPQTFLLLPRHTEMDSFTRQYQQEREKREQREETNLLYVAITRAGQYFFVSGNGKKDDSRYRRLEPHLEFDETQGELEARTAMNPEATLVTPEKPVVAPVLLTEINPSSLVASRQSYTGDEDGLDRGIVIHRALQLLNTGTDASELLATLKPEFPELAQSSLSAWCDKAQALIQGKKFKTLFDDDAYETALNEAALGFIHCGQLFYGVIDRLCIGKNSVWLVDYKTHVQAHRHADALHQQYRTQMLAYTIGVKKMYPNRKTRCSLLFTETAALADYDFSPEELEQPVIESVPRDGNCREN